MSHWPLTPEDITRPAYRSLAQGIASAIQAGTLQPGDRLPPHRDMAWRLEISVQTVSRAYEELIRADLVTGEVGRGTFVNRGPRETLKMPWHHGATERPPMDLSLMTPVCLPQIAEAWADSLHRVAGRLPEGAFHDSRPGRASSHYGEMAQAWLKRCGLTVPRSRILVTNGVTPAMFVALAAVASPGDMIATESATCHSMRPVAQHLHLRLQGIAGDERGMLPEALIEAAQAASGQMKAVFLLPSGAGPFARVIDRERRAALARAAEIAGLVILESDPLGPLVSRRPPPIASFAPDRTLYFTGLTKCLAPGLRLGFLVTPDYLTDCAASRHLSVSWMATPLIAEIASDWMETGSADRLLEAQRAELVLRNRLAQNLLGVRCLGGDQGLHRWLALADTQDERAFRQTALEHGVAVSAGAGFAVSETGPAVRLCLGGVGLRDLKLALNTLASLASGPVRPAVENP